MDFGVKLDDNFSIVMEIANNEDGIYGDIYDDYSECIKDHPNNSTIFVYEIVYTKNNYNAFEYESRISEVYDDPYEAFDDWEKYLKTN